MKDQIQPRHLRLADLLNKRLFCIPDYQRSYSWSSRERKDLFEDIKAFHKAGGNGSHFMATVVCLRRDDVALGTHLFTKLDIVDGQQRLTTLIILLNAIRWTLDKKKKKKKKQKRLAEELAELLVKPEGDNLLLLQTNHDASHYFANYMRSGTAPQPDNAKTLADKELLSAIQECKIFVEEWKNNNTLIELAALIKNHLSFILLEITNEKLVYTVFEVLNSRGMEVAWLDRLKSILMGLAFTIEETNRGDLIHELHTIWRDIYANIGLRQGLSTEALRFTATLYTSDRPSKPFNERDAVDLLRSMVNNSAARIREIAHLLLDVTKACDKVMSNPRHNAVTRIAQARLLAVAIHIGEFEDDDRKHLLDEWERISFLIYGLHAKDARFRVGEYCKLSWDIIRSDLPSNDILDHIRKLGEDYLIETAIKGCRGTDCYNDWTDELRYFLFRYEEHLAKECGLKEDNNHWQHVWAKKASQSIEHIRPQSEAPDDMKHTLGNLMLLPPGTNSRLRDKPPQQKSDEYLKTGFYHAREVFEMLKKSQKWGKKVCKKREKKMLRWAKAEWGGGKSTN